MLPACTCLRTCKRKRRRHQIHQMQQSSSIDTVAANLNGTLKTFRGAARETQLAIDLERMRGFKESKPFWRLAELDQVEALFFDGNGLQSWVGVQDDAQNNGLRPLRHLRLVWLVMLDNCSACRDIRDRCLQWHVGWCCWTAGRACIACLRRNGMNGWRRWYKLFNMFESPMAMGFEKGGSHVHHWWNDWITRKWWQTNIHICVYISDMYNLMRRWTQVRSESDE